MLKFSKNSIIIYKTQKNQNGKELKPNTNSGCRFVSANTPRGDHGLPALAEQALFARANDPTDVATAVLDLPRANCPPMADHTVNVCSYGRFELLLLN